MVQLITNSIVESTFEAVSLYSYQSKVRNEDEHLDELFDRINELRGLINKRSGSLEKLIAPTESISWINDFSANDLIKISTIVSLGRDITSYETKNWAEINRKFKKTGFCSDEITNYKHIIDDFAEAINDLNEAIFETPNDEEFQKLNQELQLLRK